MPSIAWHRNLVGNSGGSVANLSGRFFVSRLEVIIVTAQWSV